MLYLLIGLIFIYILIINPKGNVFIKALFFGLLFGIIAYYFVPRGDYDLARHHQYIKDFINNDSLNFLRHRLVLHQYETIPTLYSYLIAKLNNVNLAQFFVVTLGYGTIYYLVADYSKKTNLNKIWYIPIMLFSVFGFYVLYFISGLYFYIGTILFALAFYLDYQKDTNKILVYTLYVLTFFIHDAIFFPLMLLLLYKVFRNKMNIFTIMIISILVFFSYSILEYLANIDLLKFLKPIVKMYSSYISMGENMNRLYRGNILLIEVSKLVTTLFVTILMTKNKGNHKCYNYIYLLSFSSLFMLTKSIVMIRFCMLIQLLGIVPLIDYFNNKGNRNLKFIMFFYVLLFAMYYLIYFIVVLHGESFYF